MISLPWGAGAVLWGRPELTDSVQTKGSDIAGCWARAVSAAPASSVINSRRFTALCLPCFPTERIAHLGTVDCCIYPPGRYETIAVTPPIIFSKGGSPKTGHPISRQDLLTARNRFTTSFRGWRLDENVKPKSPPYRGATHKKLGDNCKMAVLAFSQARLRCDGPCQSRSRATWQPSRYPRPSQAAFAPFRSVTRSIFGRPSRYFSIGDLLFNKSI
jgi:hypothetical protein